MSVEWRPAWQRRKLEDLRGRADGALTELDRLGELSRGVERFLRHVVDAVSDQTGVLWVGAPEMAARLRLTERRVRQLFAEARGAGWLQRIHVGGGRHRTSRYALKFGDWRDDQNDEHMQAHFAERARVGNLAGERWLQQLFTDHLALGKTCCLVFAPAELKNPEISWAPSP